MGLFRRKRADGRSTPQNDNPFDGLRLMALGVGAGQLGLHPGADEVFGVVCDMDIGGDVATVVCMADHTVSMYTSTGGGVIGAGSHENVWQAAETLLAAAGA